MTPQLKFFIVDDDVFCANVYQHYLENLNFFDITYFSSGQECLDNLNQHPDIIFLDQNMSGLSGLEILKKIKVINPNIYVVMVTGEVIEETIIEAFKNGAFDFVKKEVTNYGKIKEVVEKIIQIKADLMDAALNPMEFKN